jgi:superoxide dismutase, Cu-Zn family
MAENGPHAGDLPNVHVGQDGLLKVEFFTERLSLAEGAANPLKDADGSAIVIHAGPDDYASDPSGNSGDRLACGVIE